MTRFITAIIIFLIIIVVCILSLSFILKKESVLEIYLDDIQSYVENNDMQNALTSALVFWEKWKQTEPYIIILLHHNLIDEITVRCSKMISYGKSNNKSEFLAEVNAIKVLLNDICDDEKPLIHNFL